VIFLTFKSEISFTFASTPTTDFSLYNVNISSGMQEEFLTHSRNVLETKIRGNSMPYFQDIEREPLEFTIYCAFEDEKDEDEIEEIINWLCNYSYYQPLYFGSQTDRIYYAMVCNDPKYIHNCLDQGYLEITFRCHDAYAYSAENTSDTYTTSATPTATLTNDGYLNVYPTIYITMVGAGDITVTNLSADITFSLTGLDDGEQIILYCEDEIITTSKSSTYRYSVFSGTYFYLIPGGNTINFTGNCTIYFKWQYKRL
jgi:phage-related protein